MSACHLAGADRGSLLLLDLWTKDVVDVDDLEQDLLQAVWTDSERPVDPTRVNEEQWLRWFKLTGPLDGDTGYWPEEDITIWRGAAGQTRKTEVMDSRYRDRSGVCSTPRFLGGHPYERPLRGNSRTRGSSRHLPQSF